MKKSEEKMKKNYEYTVTADIDLKTQITEVEKAKTKLDFEWDLNGKDDGKITIMFSIPCTGIECVWEPTCLMNRNYNLRSFASSAMGAVPLIAYCNNLGNSIFSIALSDTIKQIEYNFAINERTAQMDCKIFIDLKQFGNKNTYSLTLYTQREEMPLYEMCKNVREWWEEIYDLKNQQISDGASDLCYQTWYAFHQDMDENNVLKTFKEAKKYGIKTVILDDGWNADDRTTGAKYVGEYRPSFEKFPNMKDFVKKVHDQGQKIILWYSTSFIGFESPLWNKFKNKLLGEYKGDLSVGIMDPRYPEVREHMISLYENALKDWDIDGFKLDFVDSFRISNDCDMKEGMDYCCVKEAVERYFTDALTRLKAIKSDVIIEFRQGYVGPNMRRYASMFRVADCPEDYRFNRVGTVDLRMLSGNTVVSSDMLMWSKDDSPEVAALQILNTIFSVIQFSVDFEKMTEEQKKMAKFWLDFSLKHKHLLTEEQIKPQEVQNFYPIIKTENEDECITGIYEIDKVVKADVTKTNYLINACDNERLVIDTNKATIKYESYDCMGTLINSGILELEDGINVVSVCKSGLLIINNI